jgi:DNA-binding MarR family transcriptional regulator
MLGGAMRRQFFGDEDAPSFGQIRMLEMLNAHAWKLSDLAARHQVAVSTMSRTVDVLVKRGWVTRQEAPHDRRQVILALTESGQHTRQAIAAQSHALVTEMITQLDAHERVQLTDGLVVLQRLFEQGTGCHRDDMEQKS